jgi:hypothetical protein
MDMSKWEQFEMEERILSILRDVSDTTEGHQLGRAYLTAYQIAIEYKQRHPEAFEAFGLPVGGRGIGQRDSFSRYIAHQLSRLIGGGHLPLVEGGFLSNQHLKDIHFWDGEEEITSSLTGSGFTLSMFRLMD